MFGLFNTTPQYAGNGQPAANTSENAFGFLGGLFAFPSSPKYATADARPSTDTGTILAPVPNATPATSEQVTTQTACPDAVAMTDAASDQLAAPACSVPLPFAIVIQRSQQ